MTDLVRLDLRMAAAASALVMAVGAPARAQPPVHFGPIGDTPGFPHLRQELQRIVNAQGRSRVNTFCVMLGDRGDHEPLAYAIWRRRGLLYRWQQTDAPQLNDEALVQHEPLDLRKDIARTPAERASTYLETMAWVRDIDRQCREHGETIDIIRRSVP